MTTHRDFDKGNKIVPIMQEHLGSVMKLSRIKGVTFPLLFTMLDKRSNSNWKERTRLIDRFIRLFEAECIDSLVADREFVGKEWGEYLHNSVSYGS